MDVAKGVELLERMSKENPYAPADLALAKVLRMGSKNASMQPDAERAFPYDPNPNPIPNPNPNPNQQVPRVGGQ